jgi:hypothetical protein
MAFFTAPKGQKPQPGMAKPRPGITENTKPFEPIQLRRYRMIGPNSFVLRRRGNDA